MGPGNLAVAAVVAVAVAMATGSLSYVITHGVSMEPRFHEGDIALIRPADRYGVGDAVAYHSSLLDTVVLHRIVGRESDRYVLKGDNNHWLDADKPTRADLIGKLWVRIPRVGVGVRWVKDHRPLAVGVSSLAALGVAHRRRQTPSRHNPRNGVGNEAAAPPVRRIGGNLSSLWLGAAIGLAACLALATVAFTRATTLPVSTKVPLGHRGTFSYSAPAPAGPVYDAGRVTTGDPLYLRLMGAAEMRFSYQFDSAAPHLIGGTIRLSAELTETTGWRRSVELAPPQAFQGDRTEVRATLDAVRLWALVAEVESLTGVRTDYVTVTVVAHVQVNGEVAGQMLRDTFAPRLPFRLDAVQLRPTWTPNDRTPRQAALEPTASGSVSRPGLAPAHLSLLGRHLPVTRARVTAVGGMITCALVLVLIARRTLGGSETARIDALHGHRIIPVINAGEDTRGPVVDVTTIDDLARLAEQYGVLILHENGAGAHTYVLRVDETTYRYRVRPSDPDTSSDMARRNRGLWVRRTTKQASQFDRE